MFFRLRKLYYYGILSIQGLNNALNIGLINSQEYNEIVSEYNQDLELVNSLEETQYPTLNIQQQEIDDLNEAVDTLIISSLEG